MTAWRAGAALPGEEVDRVGSEGTPPAWQLVEVLRSYVQFSESAVTVTA